jgi:type IV secretion system protein VirB9
MKKAIQVITIILAVSSCKTMDLEKQTKRDDGLISLFESVKQEKEFKKNAENDESIPVPTAEEIAVSELNVNIEPEVIIIEKPVFVPQKDWEAEQKLSPRELTRKITEQGIVSPSDYNMAAFIYDYIPDQVYEVYTQILRTTSLTLEADESALDAPFISDSENWIIGAGVSREGEKTIQHIYLKPKKAGIESTFIINTNRRVYYLLLKSFNSVFMPIVKWRYKLPADTIAVKDGKVISGESGGIEGGGADGGEAGKKTVSLSEEIEYVDPRFLSFDYKVRHSILKKPRWLPRLVYDDGQKTYLVFNPIVLQTELPIVLENNRDIVNYRVNGDLLIIDKLVEKVTVKYQKDKIVVEKKKK